MSPLSKLLRVAVLLALAFGPRLAEAQKALVYCPVSIDATGCATIKTALTSAYPGGVETGFDGTQGTVDLKTVDLFQYSVVVVPSLADDSTAPYALLRDATVASKLKAALLGRRAFWSGTPDQGVVSTTRPQKDALIQNLAAWASGDFATVNAPGLVVLQDNSTDVTKRYDWVQAIVGFNLIADTRLASYSAVSSLTAAGNAVLSSNGSTLAYANMASMGFQTPSGAPGTSMDAVGKTGTGVGGQVVLITQTGANTGGAVVATDKDDYAPGMPVVITGSGFGAGETVTLTLHEDPTIEADFSFTTTADQNGGFVFNGFTPDTLDVDVRFVLTATGQTTGRRAQTTFTDGPLPVQLATTDNSAPANVTWSVTWSVWQTAGGVCTGNPNSTNTTTYTGNTVDNGGQNNPPSANQNQSIKIISAQATGTFAAQYAFNYWSSTANSTTPVTPSCAAGTQGNTQIGTLFAHFKSASQSVNVSVSTSGTPSAFGSSVTFTATASPLTATGSVQFKDGAANLGSSVNLVNGVATLSTSALSVGQHTISVTYTPGNGFTAGTVTPVTQNVGLASQTIAGFNLSTLNKVFGDAPFSIASGVTGGASGNPVTFASLTTSTCTITAAGQVTIVATGQCTATADQTGNSNYSPAPQVSQSFTIGQATATLAIDPASLTATYDGAAHAATVTTTPAGLTVVAITYNGLPTAPTNAGSYPVVAKLTNANYSATDATGTLTIAQAQPQFTGLSTPAITYGTSTAAISGAVKAGSLPAIGTVGITVSGTGGAITGSASVDASGNFSTTVNVAALPANAAGYDVALVLPASANFKQASDNTQKLIINKAAQTITFGPLAGKTYGDAPFTVSATSSSGLAVSFTASGNCTISGNTVTITGAGNCTVNADQAGDGNFQPATQVPQSFAIGKANATINVTGFTGTYDGSAHGATGSATGIGGASLSGLDLGASFTNVPGGTANWTFTDATGNYNNASGSAAIVISKADATISVNGYSGVYDGDAHGATGTAKGVKNEDLTGLTLGATFTNVPGGTASWSYTDVTGNYNNASGSVAITISKADATIAVSGYTGTYDAAAHGATGSAKGVKGETLSGLDLGNSFTNVPGGTANWAFTDVTGNYNNTSGTAAIVITKADPTIVVDGYTGVYDGAAHGATGTAKGIGGVALAGLDLGASFTNVPGGTASWKFTDATGNYNDAAGTAAIVITKADATIAVNGYTGVYDGDAHGATGAAKGVKGEDLAGLTLGSSFTNVPGGTASWAFTDVTGNYKDATGTAAITITKANATVAVTGYTGTYDGAAHGASGSAKGVKNEVLSGLNLGASFTNAPGGTASWAFTDATGNYNNASGSAAIVINQAPTMTAVTCLPGPFYYTGSAQTPCSANVTGVLLNQSVPVTYGNNVNAGTATASATYAATQNYLMSSDSKTFVINKATIAAPILSNLVQAWTGSLLRPSVAITPAGVQVTLSFIDDGAPVGSNAGVAPVGVYNVTATITDPNYTGNPTDGLFVIYDASAGFVTGGGWINSPAGAYVADITLTGKANFGFVSKYQKGANTPTGNTEFQFKEGNLNFSSTNFQWLVIQGTTSSQFKGTGTINGKGSYNFMVTAVDGDNYNGTKKPDSFRMKITDMAGNVVYDNQQGVPDATISPTAQTYLGGGSIVIHDK